MAQEVGHSDLSSTSELHQKWGDYTTTETQSLLQPEHRYTPMSVSKDLMTQSIVPAREVGPTPDRLQLCSKFP